MKTDKELDDSLSALRGKKEEVSKAFLLLGFKGVLDSFFGFLLGFVSDLLVSKVNKADHKVFSGADYSGKGTDADPYRIKFPESANQEIIRTIVIEHEGMKERIKMLEEYIQKQKFNL